MSSKDTLKGDLLRYVVLSSLSGAAILLASLQSELLAPEARLRCPLWVPTLGQEDPRVPQTSSELQAPEESDWVERR